MPKMKELLPHLKRLRKARERFELAFEQDERGEWKDFTEDQMDAVKAELTAILSTITEESHWIEKHVPKHRWDEYLN